MNNQESIIEKFYALRPNDYPTLLRLSLSQKFILPGDPPAIDVEAELSHKDPGHQERLLLNFYGVSNYKFNQPLASHIQIIQFEITSLTDWQWENAKYKVAEVEESVFSLLCKEFSARLQY